MQASHAKVILFGEYALLKGGAAVGVPLHQFAGELSLSEISSKKAIASNKSLRKYFVWLQNESSLHPYIQLDFFSVDLKEGVWLNSNIPSNAGLGSSGSVVAAVLKQYGTAALNAEPLVNLRHILARFEGYFHGTSSGIDPLISFLGKAVLLHGLDEISLLPEHTNRPNLFHPFLLPIKGKGKTNDLVQRFNETWLDLSYNRAFKRSYLPRNNAMVDAFVKGDEHVFWSQLFELSKSQLNIFPAMIDIALRDMMLDALEHKHFGIKICGSGGGGFALGFAKNLTETKKRLPSAIFLNV